MLSKLTSESDFDELQRFVPINVASLSMLVILLPALWSTPLANIAGSWLQAEACRWRGIEKVKMRIDKCKMEEEESRQYPFQLGRKIQHSFFQIFTPSIHNHYSKVLSKLRKYASTPHPPLHFTFSNSHFNFFNILSRNELWFGRSLSLHT